VDDDIDLGLILLVSTIENISRKYGGIEEKFDETNEFYLKLKKIIDKLPQTIESSIRDDLFEEIGRAYLSLSHLRIKAKYKNFCLSSLSHFIYNEKFEEMISNLYTLRSKILHAGEILEFRLRDQIIMYNPRNSKSGNIKKYKDEKGEHSIIIRIPSYNDLLKIFADIIVNFIRYLYTVKDDEEDKMHYKESDTKKRNIVIGSLNKEGKKPGSIINLNTDYYRRIDFIDLTQIENTLKAIERSNKINIEEKLKKVVEIIQKPNFSVDYISFRRACYLKIIFLHDLERYDECLEMFEKYQISEINEETFPVFNTKAYCLAKREKFEKAHVLIDKVLEIVDKEKENKARFLDSKGDFYKMEDNRTKAIEFYKKSLRLFNEPPFPFHEETKKKLKECKEREKNK